MTEPTATQAPATPPEPSAWDAMEADLARDFATVTNSMRTLGPVQHIIRKHRAAIEAEATAPQEGAVAALREALWNLYASIVSPANLQNVERFHAEAKRVYDDTAQAAADRDRRLVERFAADLHAVLGTAGEGIGVWTHRAEPDGLGEQKARFLTFRVEDVHAAIDRLATPLPVESTTESEVG